MPKNIVVFSDGTGQDGGARPEQRISNIYKTYRVSRDHADTAIDPSQQVVFYDAGLGTDIGATALTAPVRFVQKLLGSVMGAGIKRNIADCYEFIINQYATALDTSNRVDYLVGITGRAETKDDGDWDPQFNFVRTGGDHERAKALVADMNKKLAFVARP
jgi:hypothetical protein